MDSFGIMESEFRIHLRQIGPYAFLRCLAPLMKVHRREMKHR